MNLRELDSSSMLDVIHVLFEEDMIPTWEQGPEVKSAARSSIYRELYGTEYKYASSSSANYSGGSNSGRNIYEEPVGGGVKPYIPPTNPEDLSSILGAPMGE